LVVALASAATAGLPPQPAKPVDSARFVGRWYEIARMPNKFQNDCATSLADWSRSGNSQFNVVQTCHVDTPTGRTRIWRSSGRILDPVTNAKFRMSFFGGLISQDYWVLDRSDDYSWFILSTPSPRYIWIFSRQPSIAPAQRSAVIAVTRAMGYDVGSLVFDQPGA
jgi:apolipoprotein D and lipocalin family protein